MASISPQTSWEDVLLVGEVQLTPDGVFDVVERILTKHEDNKRMPGPKPPPVDHRNGSLEDLWRAVLHCPVAANTSPALKTWTRSQSTSPGTCGLLMFWVLTRCRMLLECRKSTPDTICLVVAGQGLVHHGVPVR